LWTERRGGSLPLSEAGYWKLVEILIQRCAEEGLFREAFGPRLRWDDFGQRRAGRHDPHEFFTFKLGDPWAADVLDGPRL
jgi:hypothetical protein